jgi:hypothetical protein
MAYEQIPTVKLAHAGSDEGYMIVNAADYRADQPQWMYDQGLAYDPAVWKPYVEPTLRAAAAEAHEAPARPVGRDAPAAPDASAEAPEHAPSGSHRGTGRH